ncbi:10376_t:CDS:1 [Cetraspora pellucida]|uniref:10376_t:CDS:1 n=1 Tax=Cetraspora pellucida TaxID=1433469 RepID=A0A9N9A2S0_9GLOM|nr:10376_t:CDS:1 [Cetraspora pellucida]
MFAFSRLSIECLEVMAQMHSFLVENTKSELNYVDQNISQEDLLSIFNQIANSIEDGTDLFSEENSFSFLEEFMKENTEDVLEELEELVNENSMNLEVGDFISLSSRLEPNEYTSLDEKVIHKDRDFDVNDLINN